MIVPTAGVEGAPGAVLMTTLAEAADVHPEASVTVKLYVAAASPMMVVLAPEPATAPGLIVQLPAGSPLRTTLPVGSEQVGWVTVPVVGAAGGSGCVLIITSADAAEIQPAAFVTVKLYVPVASPVIVVLIPVPAIPPGLIVHVPAGRLFNITLPVAIVQVGWLIVPTVGAEGVDGCVLMTTRPGDVRYGVAQNVEIRASIGK